MYLRSWWRNGWLVLCSVWFSQTALSIVTAVVGSPWDFPLAIPLVGVAFALSVRSLRAGLLIRTDPIVVRRVFSTRVYPRALLVDVRVGTSWSLRFADCLVLVLADGRRVKVPSAVIPGSWWRGRDLGLQQLRRAFGLDDGHVTAAAPSP